MRFQNRPMEPADAEVISHWRYSPPYNFYDLDADPDDLIEFMDTGRWAGEPHWAFDDESGLLAGFLTAQVQPGGVYMGLGLRPDLTGRGIGVSFMEACLEVLRHQWPRYTLRLDVALFNQRAIRVYERTGFMPLGTFWQDTNGGRYEFLAMQRKEED